MWYYIDKCEGFSRVVTLGRGHGMRSAYGAWPAVFVVLPPWAIARATTRNAAFHRPTAQAKVLPTGSGDTVLVTSGTYCRPGAVTGRGITIRRQPDSL